MEGMDNLSSHKVKGVEEALAQVGATALYLPPNSPDLNPMEMLMSKLKAQAIPHKVRFSGCAADFCVEQGQKRSASSAIMSILAAVQREKMPRRRRARIVRCCPNLRKLMPRSPQQLLDDLLLAIQNISSSDDAAWFLHAGYRAA